MENGKKILKIILDFLNLPSDGEVNAHVRPELAALGSEVTTSGVSALENITCRDPE